MLLPENEANLLINTGDFMENFRRKTKWMERTLGINSTSFISDLLTSGSDIIATQYDDSKYDELEEEAMTGNNNNTTSQPKVRRSSTINLQRRKRKNLLRYANKFNTTETEGRAIGDINFSLTNTDWFLASYFTKNEEEIGIILNDMHFS